MSGHRWQKGGMLRRLLFGGVVVVICLAGLVGMGEVLLEDRRERARADQAIATIFSGMKSSLAVHARENDTVGFRKTLDQAFADPGIAGLRLDADDGRVWTLGDLQESQDRMQRRFPVDAAAGLGELALVHRLNSARLFSVGNVAERIGVIGLPMMMVALAMLMLFDRLIGQHLRDLIAMTATSWLKGETELDLSHGGRNPPDELSALVSEINQGRQLLHREEIERGKLLTELADLNKKFSETNEEQANFAYAVSHDLRAPNNTAAMLMEEFKGEIGESLNPEAQSILDDLDRSIARLGRLIEDMMGYTRAIGTEDEKEEINLDRQVRDIMRDLTASIRDSKAELIVRDLPKVHGIPFQIRALLKNLISNAIKFHDEDRGPLIEIWGGAAAVKGQVQLSVRDNGIGIDAEHQEQIFDLFKKLHGQDMFEGSGMGLSMCQRIAVNHGGRIEVHSKKGSGSTFTVFLPGTAIWQAADAAPGLGSKTHLLRLGLNVPTDDCWAEAARAFAVDLAKTSDGSFNVMVLPGRRVSRPDEILQQVSAGSLDMAIVPSAELANLSPDLGVLCAPYLADDFAHAGRILRSPVARALLDPLPDQIGAVGVGFGLGGFRQIATRGEINRATDLKGVRMRIPPVLPLLDFYAALGVEPVPVALQNAPEAFASGRVDAMDMGAELVVKMNYLVHVDTLLQSNHIMFPAVGLISQRIWAGLTETQRNLVGGLLAKHLDSLIERNAASESGFLQQIEAAGKQVKKIDPSFFGDAVAGWNTIWANRSGALARLRQVAAETRVPPG